MGKGLNYGIKNRDFNKFEILCRFEELAQKLQGEQLTSESINDKYSVNPLDTFFGNLQFLSEEFINSAKVTQNSLTHDEEKTLFHLKRKVKEKNL